ncbi:MAG: NAD(P)-dependent oxidoreductase [Thiobacillus sp.]|nr:NAD(P)-dependent oxidoreductase [Thiobacillus sp.]
MSPAASAGFIGLGTMGRPMALNLSKGGVLLTVHNRTLSSAEALRAAGARVAESPFLAAAGSDILFVNVADDSALESVMFGPRGAAEGLGTASVVVDLGTTSLTATRACSARLAGRGVIWMDAPVSGGEAGARTGTLSIMVGGPTDAFTRVLPLLQLMGQNIVHVGDTGAGQVAKACNQIVVSATLMGVAEALTFAQREDVDPTKVRQALLGGFAYSRILEVHGQRMLDGNFIPGFKARLHKKDLGLVLAEAMMAGVALPVTAQAASAMDALVARGEGELDSSALIHIIQSLQT